ncbi:hypothetical protein CaCOL14_012403 [Colletotrichum acutatum]
MLNRHRGSVRINKARNTRNEPLGAHPLSPDLVVQNLGRVQRLQRCPAEAPKDTVREDHGNEGIGLRFGDGVALVEVVLCFCGEDVDRDVDEPREQGAPEEQRPAADLVDEEGAEDAADERYDRVDSVEEELSARVRDADAAHHAGNSTIIRDDRSPNELRKDGNKHNEPHAVPVRPVVDENLIVPVIVSELLLGLQRRPDLVELELDERRVRVPVAVVLCQDRRRAVRMTLRPEPARALR